jgi:hypothetical protein
MTEGDKAICAEMTRMIITDVMEDHIKNCPHHRAFLISKARVIGILVGVVAASSITSGGMTAIVIKIMANIAG